MEEVGFKFVNLWIFRWILLLHSCGSCSASCPSWPTFLSPLKSSPNQAFITYSMSVLVQTWKKKNRMCTKRNTKTLPISKAIFFILKISIKMKTHRTGFEIIGKSQCHNQNRTQYLRYNIFWPVVACYMWVSLISFNIYHMPSWEQFILFR